MPDVSLSVRFQISLVLSSLRPSTTTFMPTRFEMIKANEPCHFTYLCYRAPLYFGGRYLKSEGILDDSVTKQLEFVVLSQRAGDLKYQLKFGTYRLKLQLFPPN